MNALSRSAAAPPGEFIYPTHKQAPELKSSQGIKGQSTARGENINNWSKADWSKALAGVLSDLGRPGLVAQPIINLVTGDIAGYELLARFDGPTDATPDMWFRNADLLGLATALTSRVLEHAFDLRKHLPKNKFFTINIEPHLVSDPAVMHTLQSMANLDRIIIELTGNTPIQDDQALNRASARIRSAGGLIAVDDAGAGYAGLRQLILIRPDIVKIDQTLVRKVDIDPLRRGAVGLLYDLVSRMDARVLAKGVETHGELQVLASLGVPLVQGWLLAQPGSPWPSLTQETVDLIQRTTAQAAMTDQIAPLIRECTTVDRSIWCSSNISPPHTKHKETVVVDGYGQPMGIVAKEKNGNRYLAPVMTVTSSSPPIEAARKAMARSSIYRGIPLVSVDARGKATGIIDTSELFDAAINAAARTAAQENI